jgi:uncharacterized protein (TIGR03000 family)
MFRKLLTYSSTFLIVGALFMAAPGLAMARGGGHGGGGHGGGGHFGGGFGGAHFGGSRVGGYYGGNHSGFAHGYYGSRDYDHHGYGYYGDRGFYRHPYGYYGYYPYHYGYYGGADPNFFSGPVNVLEYNGYYPEVTPPYSEGYDAVAPPAAPNSPVADAVARISANVPANAQLWFGNTLTFTTGPVRQFESPPLVPGNRYDYEIRATWTENGHQVTQTQRVDVAAGAHVTVTFPLPPKV